MLHVYNSTYFSLPFIQRSRNFSFQGFLDIRLRKRNRERMTTRKGSLKRFSIFLFFSCETEALRSRIELLLSYTRRETRPRPSSTKGESGESAAQLEEPTKFVCSAHSRFPPRFPAFPPFVAAHNDEQCGNAEGFPESGCLLCRRQNMNAILSLRSNPRSSSSPA